MARVRSPNYPAIPLGEAIERVRKVHKAEQHLPAAREVIVRDLGYGGLNGASLKVLSALIKYGLLEEVGDKLKVSERAMDILFAPDPASKATAIREAAFSPSLFADFQSEWDGSIPSDENIRHYLLKRNFAHSAIDGVISTFRETMELVTPESGVYPDPDQGPKGRSNQEVNQMQQPTPQPQANKPAWDPSTPKPPFHISLAPGRLYGDFDLADPSDADGLIAAINAWKVLLSKAN